MPDLTFPEWVALAGASVFLIVVTWTLTEERWHETLESRRSDPDGGGDRVPGGRGRGRRLGHAAYVAVMMTVLLAICAAIIALLCVSVVGILQALLNG